MSAMFCPQIIELEYGEIRMEIQFHLIPKPVLTMACIGIALGPFCLDTYYVLLYQGLLYVGWKG